MRSRAKRTARDLGNDDGDEAPFSFDVTGNRELPLIIGQLTVLSKAYYEQHEFNKTTLSPMLGSGP